MAECPFCGAKGERIYERGRGKGFVRYRCKDCLGEFDVDEWPEGDEWKAYNDRLVEIDREIHGPMPGECPDCFHRKDEHEHPYGCARCACTLAFWGFPED